MSVLVGASTDGCPVTTTMIPPHQSSNFSMNISINWPESNLGENVTVDCPCGNLTLDSDSLVAHHFCGGNFRTGGRWEKLIDTRCNASDISRKICELSNVSTNTLYLIYNNYPS